MEPGAGETMCAAGTGTCRSRMHCQSLVMHKAGRAVEADTEEWTGHGDKLNSMPAGKGEIITRPNFITAEQAMRGEFGNERQ